MGRERPGFQLGMVLHADEPGVIRDLDDLRQDAVGRHAGEAQPDLLKPPADYGADIACGDIQSLGIHMQFGGGHAGYIAVEARVEEQAESGGREGPGRRGGELRRVESPYRGRAGR